MADLFNSFYFGVFRRTMIIVDNSFHVKRKRGIGLSSVMWIFKIYKYNWDRKGFVTALFNQFYFRVCIRPAWYIFPIE